MLRIEMPFPALVRGVDVHQQAFEEQTVLDNLSASGLSLRLTRCVEQGASLFVVLRLGIQPDAPAPRVALRGVIQRVEPNHDATCRLAVVFSRYRFLYASAE
ncbi:MAG: PilZ domain-containing protein [Chloroflexi bacterium]|nr:PilZ domain-containing protein [Chloroflexota bacterium]